MRNAVAVVVAVAAAVLSACSASDVTSTGKGTDTTGTTQEFPILRTAGSDNAFSAATDGTNFLVETGTGDTSATGSQTVADALQLVSSTGTLVGNLIPLGTNNRRDLGFVAFDGNQYFVEYEHATSGEDIFGQFVSRAGALVGQPIAVTTTHDAFLTYANVYGGGTYLLTYGRLVFDPAVNDSVLEGFARTVSPSGSLGAEVQFNPHGVRSDAAFGGGNFLVTYFRGGANERQVKVRPVSTTGVMGTEVGLGPSGATNGGQLIASNGTNFLVAWGNAIAGDSAGRSSGLTVQLVSPAGATIGGATTVPFASGAGQPVRIVASGTNYLVTWLEGKSRAWTTKAQWFNGSGAPTGSAFTITGPDATSVSAATWLNPAGANRFLGLVIRFGTAAGATQDLYGHFFNLSP